MPPLKLGRYVCVDGNEYEAIGTATHSQTQEEMILYHLVPQGNLLTCPVSAWNEMHFTHADDVPTIEPLGGINKYSLPQEKINLFLSLFSGKPNAYAKRWESTRTGKSGYAPDCHNAWTALCPKHSGNKVKCSECTQQSFLPFDAIAVEKHLNGRLTIGVYPMLSDETCNFLAFDFDAKEGSPDNLAHDINAIRGICNEHGMQMAIERSRSGKGVHFWIFFAESISASIARKFGSSLITYAMVKHHQLSFKTYDRLIPAQDSLPKGGFGNLIALPLQKQPRRYGNSVFIDEKFTPYPDQWRFLSQLQKYTLAEVEQFIRKLSPISDLGQLQDFSESDDEKPWATKKSAQLTLSKSDFPSEVTLVCANMLYIEKKGIKSPVLNALKRLAAFRNPEFYKAQAMRLSTHNKPRIIDCSHEAEQYLCLPRGLYDEVYEMFNLYGVKLKQLDETNSGKRVNAVFTGQLGGAQQQASDALLSHENGILSATTAFGKTVIGAHLIASRKVNTLILVHRTSLLHQWISRLNDFLQIDEVPDPEYTPKGRLRKKNVIGQIGGGKTSLSGIIDVAVMQSLTSGDEVKELVKNYGMVIVDECHHVSAFTFEQILKAVSAKYVYGLTATPTRKDGHHPIIYMQCGKIRYQVDAKQQAAERPFEHFLIPRFTRFQKPAHQAEDNWSITEIYNSIGNSELRNRLIVQDVLATIAQGRNPLILTERTEHVKTLIKMLSPHVKNTIALTGSTSQKKNRETLQKVEDIPANEPFVLVTTGRYVGEGFDMPRLDTLFLAMPISWKGTVQQYAGRLHRLFDGKIEVQVYDYIDARVPMLERMYQKRLRGYAAIGYKVKNHLPGVEEAHSIFDSHTFFPAYSADILAAQTEVFIVSPFLTKRRILADLQHLLSTGAKITVVTRPTENYAVKDRQKVGNCISLLQNHGIVIKTKEHIHQKFAVIDQRVIWYGSINLLGYGASEEGIMRIENMAIAEELLASCHD